MFTIDPNNPDHAELGLLIATNQKMAADLLREGVEVQQTGRPLEIFEFLLDLLCPLEPTPGATDRRRLEFELRWAQRVHDELAQVGAQVRAAILTHGTPTGNGGPPGIVDPRQLRG